MTRMTVTIDETILEEAKDLLHSHTKRETIEIALKEVINQKKREKAIKHCGAIDLNVTQQELESFREQV